jgi:hypothetical protein
MLRRTQRRLASSSAPPVAIPPQDHRARRFYAIWLRGVACGEDRIDVDTHSIFELHVASTPTRVKYEDAKSAIEIANRMRAFVRFTLAHNDVADFEYQKIESVFREAFANLTCEDKGTLAG